MEGQELILFAASCRFMYQTIVDQLGYWEQKYRQTFPLCDKREQEWLTWHSWQINIKTKLKEHTPSVIQKKQKRSLSATIATTDDNSNEIMSFINNLPSAFNFNATQ
ncbi:hypothetical protein BDF19DRAFT_284470 [Syncephalis fuscata]|nr:hypothetical protein BDF19DRAFT_284470 [Syncephalis fuscata]